MMTFILKKKCTKPGLWLLPTVTTRYLLIIPKSFFTVQRLSQLRLYSACIKFNNLTFVRDYFCSLINISALTMH